MCPTIVVVDQVQPCHGAEVVGAIISARGSGGTARFLGGEVLVFRSPDVEVGRLGGGDLLEEMQAALERLERRSGDGVARAAVGVLWGWGAVRDGEAGFEGFEGGFGEGVGGVFVDEGGDVVEVGDCAGGGDGLDVGA